jgi:transposase
MRTNDARQLDHATLEAMRERAVRSVQEGESPEVVARVIGVGRSTMYGWLAQYRVSSTGARYRMSLISAVTSRGQMRFMTKEKGGVNAAVFIEFLKRLMIGSRNKIFLIVDRGPAHVAKKTKAFVAGLGGKLRLFYLPPYSPDRNPDELVWKHLKSDTVGRTSITCLDDFRNKVKSSMLSLQRDPDKIRSFFHKPSLKYAA